MSSSARVLTPRELLRVIEHVAKGRSAARNKCIVILSYRAGLRACEIAGLDWTMVSTVEGRIAPLLTISGRIAKNGHQRIIPMHANLTSALRNLHREQGRPTAGAVIRSQRGGYMTARSIVNWFTQLYDELGFDGCSSHSGRRTFITETARLLVKAGGSLRDVQELAGHRALATTERYIEGDRQAQRKLIRLLR